MRGRWREGRADFQKRGVKIVGYRLK